MKLDDGHGFDKVWGIVTDAEKWYFMECTQGSEDAMKDMAERSLVILSWLLEESQKADSAVNLDKERDRSG
ncbi:hypothetical protein RirG_006470 [Rhizophagus irregularis DAOM 197198w]|uniref:Uncharacterized protein n=1 Tax=Rhizophagus irregularis (strain DAOM 197198w) TaxID=1432141 RepID=A0A015LI25_RHIIW|nr:hypothetical protein RirG_006470 [Rhizophagus irregularis DAOM 197198w]